MITMKVFNKILIYLAVAVLLLVLAVLAVIFWPREPVPDGAVPRKDIVSYFVGDVTNDGEPELLVISGAGKIDTGERYGQFLLVCDASFADDLTSLRYIPSEKIYHRIDLAGIMPMKVQIGDVNGDGINEVAICVYKTAKFHEVMAKRPFFFDLVDGNLIPVWLGSRLSRPFDDYILHDINADGIDEIISIELLEDGKRVIAAYVWKGFGFEVHAESKAFDGVLSFDAATDDASGICVTFSAGREQSALVFSLKDDSLVYEETNS